MVRNIVTPVLMGTIVLIGLLIMEITRIDMKGKGAI